MAILTINGRAVNVPDSFKSLSPADQEKTVEEIAAQLGVGNGSKPPANAEPGTAEYAQWAAKQAASGNRLPQVSGAAPEWQAPDNVPAWLRAFSNHAVESTPIVGGLAAQAGNSPLVQAQAQSADQQAPWAATAGDLFGNVVPFLAGGEIPVAAKALGMASDIANPVLNLAARTGASALTNAAISGADTATRGGDAGDIAQSAAIGGAAGAIMPGAGDLLAKGAGLVGQKAVSLWDAFTNTDRAAQKAVSGAAAQDIRAGQQLTPADEANAALNGQPIVNADRFGGAVQSLARTARNSNPTAGAALSDLAQDRFLTQSNRARDFVKRITGGATDDLALQDQIASQARLTNRAAYDRAYAAPGAQSVLTPDIIDLFKSPDFRRAVGGASKTAGNDAAISGGKAVGNPFIVGSNGEAVGLKTLSDGSRAVPNLQFWDIVQRNLRAQADQAQRSGDNLLASQLGQMRTKLLNGLDNAVPDFAKARAGAAAAFGAQDAVEAGRKFVSQKMGIPEAQRAYAKFSPAEKKAFGVGFASELIDKIGAASDRVNVINQVFGSPAARQQVEMALGKNAARQLEQFVRVEDAMQATKQAVQGNSTTAAQLAAMGALGGVGAGAAGVVSNWDPKMVASGAFLLPAARIGARAMRKAIDQKVMSRVAEILASSDPKEIDRLVLNATLSPKFADAVQAIEMGLQATARAGADQSQRPQPALAAP
jgi:hypothetical protein